MQIQFSPHPDLLPLENAVMQMLMAGDSALMQGLRRQFAAVRVEKRRYSGVGFFVDFLVDDDALAVPGIARVVIDNVCGESPRLELGAGFLLFVEGGKLSMLEGCSYGDDWLDPTDDPEAVCASFRLRYSDDA